MADSSRVLDASVAAKCFIEEHDSGEARRQVLGALDWIAPDLIFLEIASVMTKALRAKALTEESAQRAVVSVGLLLAETVPGRELAERAFQLACGHGFSVYDAAYLALAQREGVRLLTADRRLMERAQVAGLPIVDLLGMAG